MTSGDPEELLTPRQAATVLGIDTSTLYRWATSGRVSYVELTGSGYRRYRRKDLVGLVREVPLTDPEQETTP
jgi:excisionase family DNA binding protein